jgi:hypothetical protein
MLVFGVVIGPPLGPLSPHRSVGFNTAVRSHWGFENQLHWVFDAVDTLHAVFVDLTRVAVAAAARSRAVGDKCTRRIFVVLSEPRHTAS